MPRKSAYLDVLTSNTTLFSAELNLAIVRQNKLLSLVHLYNVLGGGREGNDPGLFMESSDYSETSATATYKNPVPWSDKRTLKAYNKYQRVGI
jgi:hypothetical protein